MDENGECLECGDSMMGPAFKCSGCGEEACDSCIHHGRHIDANEDIIDMSGTSLDPEACPCCARDNDKPLVGECFCADWCEEICARADAYGEPTKGGA